MTVEVPMFYRVVGYTNAFQIPIATIAVDGQTQDWASVRPSALSPPGCNQGEGSPAGADVKSLWLAQSGKTLYFLFEVWGNQVDQTGEINYRIWTDNNKTGEYLVSCQHNGDWPNQIELGTNAEASANGRFLEGRVDIGALGINKTFRLESGTHAAESFENYDRFPEVPLVLLNDSGAIWP